MDINKMDHWTPKQSEIEKEMSVLILEELVNRTYKDYLPKNWEESRSEKYMEKGYIPLLWDWWFFERNSSETSLIIPEELKLSGIKGSPDCYKQRKIWPDLLLNYNLPNYPLIDKKYKISEPMRKIIWEYDGKFWHKNKIKDDKNKTAHSLYNGYIVIRLREDGLDDLDLSWHYKTYNFLQLTVHNKKELPEKILTSFNWLDSLNGDDFKNPNTPNI